MGIVSGDDFQIVYSDTPGILKPAYKLQESMMKFVNGALTDADVILYVTDTVEQSDRSVQILENIRHSGIPSIVVINKIDLSNPRGSRHSGRKVAPDPPRSPDRPRLGQGAVQPRGALKTILELLPEGPAFYPKDTLTDKTLRFFASEIIREKILRFYDKEIPYCCEIEIESYKEEPTIDRISATIFVSRESQKGIIIGHKGEKLKRVGQGRTRRHGAVPRQEGLPAALRQGQRRLAEQRSAAPPLRIRNRIADRPGPGQHSRGPSRTHA